MVGFETVGPGLARQARCGRVRWASAVRQARCGMEGRVGEARQAWCGGLGAIRRGG